MPLFVTVSVYCTAWLPAVTVPGESSIVVSSTCDTTSVVSLTSGSLPGGDFSGVGERGSANGNRARSGHLDRRRRRVSRRQRSNGAGRGSAATDASTRRARRHERGSGVLVGDLHVRNGVGLVVRDRHGVGDHVVGLHRVADLRDRGREQVAVERDDAELVHRAVGLHVERHAAKVARERELVARVVETAVDLLAHVRRSGRAEVVAGAEARRCRDDAEDVVGERNRAHGAAFTGCLGPSLCTMLLSTQVPAGMVVCPTGYEL